jgi:hypothetical protein
MSMFPHGEERWRYGTCQQSSVGHQGVCPLHPVILAHHGTVNKYVGDAIPAMFSSSEPDAMERDRRVLLRLSIDSAGPDRQG